MKVECQDCRGLGHYWERYPIWGDVLWQCPRCDGTGEIDEDEEEE